MLPKSPNHSFFVSVSFFRTAFPSQTFISLLLLFYAFVFCAVLAGLSVWHPNSIHYVCLRITTFPLPEILFWIHTCQQNEVTNIKKPQCCSIWICIQVQRDWPHRWTVSQSKLIIPCYSVYQSKLAHSYGMYIEDILVLKNDPHHSLLYLIVVRVIATVKCENIFLKLNVKNRTC